MGKFHLAIGFKIAIIFSIHEIIADEEAFSELQGFLSKVGNGNSVKIHTEVNILAPGTASVLPNFSATSSPEPLPKSCDDVAGNQTGVHKINITGVGITVVYCDGKTNGGEWTVFQRRRDGSVDFYRDWDDYVTGFGNANGELWLGLEAIHQLTKNGDCELRIDMIGKYNGARYHANCSYFQVGPASDNYRLHVNGFSGNISDALASHNNRPFSTKDRDNDAASFRDCAEVHSGAWWYKSCLYSNLNGMFNGVLGKGLFWYADNHMKTMKFSEMKLRRKG